MNSFNFSTYEANGRKIEEEEEKIADPTALNTSFDFSLYEPIPADSPTEKIYSTSDKVKDYGKQFAKEGLIGLGGTWGDLAELAGLSGKNPAIEEKNSRDFEVLKKMEDPNYKPSFMERFVDITSLESDDDIVPRFNGFSTSKDLRQINDQIGGPGEAETEWGKLGGRQGKFYGSGVATGQINPIPALLAGGVGQGLEELGVGETGQMIGEIVTLLLSPSGSKGQLGERASREVKTKINDLRNLGYTDEQITLAINSASKGKKAGVKATKGTKTEQAFENFAEHSDDMVNGILENGIQGYEKGAKHVHQMASDAYGEVVKEASKIGIKKLDPFFDSMDATMKEIKRSIGHNPEAKNFITELTAHTLDIISNPTADNMIDFYKRLNGLGKWVGRNQKDRIISNVKESIKDSFISEGKQGKELAHKFEKVNEGIKKAYQAEDVMQIVDKATTQQGIDYKKLNKAFDKKDNVKLFEEVLGKKQADNLHMIAKTGKEVKDFDKAWKTVSLVPEFNLKSIAGHGAAYYLLSGNWAALALGKGTEIVARKLAEKSLTDPKFQNLMIRGLHAVKNNSPKTLRNSIDQMQKYLDEEGINIKLTDSK